MNDDVYEQDAYDNDPTENEEIDPYDLGYKAGACEEDCHQSQSYDPKWVKGWEDVMDDEADKEKALRMRDGSFNP